MASAGKPRRVLIVVENLPVPFDRRVWQEATSLQAAGYQVSVICPMGKGHEARHEVIAGVHIYRHPLGEADGKLGYVVEYASALFWETLLAWKVLFTRGFDVIHACNPPDLIFLVAAPFKLVGKRFVFDHHDLCPELYEAKFNRRGLGYRIMGWLEKLTFRMADVSIATNESYKAIAQRRGGMAENRVFVVRSGPDLTRVKRVPKNPSWRAGRAHLVGYVGVMGRQEGIDILLRAARRIVYAAGRRDVQFVLVGGGTELERMRQYALELELEDFVTFTGRVSDEVLLEVLSTADVCVNPDVPNEMNDKSTMNKIMEYMALGKPIVQFDLKEGRYSAQDASLYARRHQERDFADKILQLLDDPSLREEMGRRGQARVESELSWEYQRPRLLAAYEAAFGDAGGPLKGGVEARR